MFWECSECGGRCERSTPPRVCPCCGLASALFMSTEEDHQALDPVSPGLGEDWNQEPTELQFGST